MDTTFTEEQEMLAATAGRIAADLGPTSVLDLDYPHNLDDPHKDLAAGAKELVAAGMLGLSIPEEMGGSGATAVEVGIVAEAFGRHLVPVPLVGPVLALELLAADGQDDVVSAALGGERAVTLGLDPHLTGPAHAPHTTLVAWDAALADDAVTLDGPLLVPLAGATRIDCADLTRRLSSVQGMHVDSPRTDLSRWEAFALSLLCADMVGAMAGALDLAVAHARARTQFGQPIGSFQAIQHLCAEQLVSLEAARSATYYSAWAVDGRPGPEALRAARTAKAYVSRAGRAVTEAVLQVHGGIGQTWESLAHVYLRRVLLDRATLGDEAVQVERLGRELQE